MPKHSDTYVNQTCNACLEIKDCLHGLCDECNNSSPLNKKRRRRRVRKVEKPVAKPKKVKKPRIDKEDYGLHIAKGL